MILFLGKNVIPPLYHLIVFCYLIYLIAFLKRSSSRSAFYEKLNDACIKRMCVCVFFYLILLHKAFQQCNMSKVQGISLVTHKFQRRFTTLSANQQNHGKRKHESQSWWSLIALLPTAAGCESSAFETYL